MTWFRSYLADRTRTFVAGKDHHGPLPVNCGVPQGSVLGRIKFIACAEYVTELVAQHGVGDHLFADDKQLYTAVPRRDTHRPSTPNVRLVGRNLNASEMELI